MIKRFTAKYIYTMDSKPLKDAVVSVNENGEIVEISEKHTGDEIYFDGVICPAFINVHCHSELSFAKDKIEPKTGIDTFIHQLEILKREISVEEKQLAIVDAINTMKGNGIVAVGDIINSDISIMAKRDSTINFYNFIEIFGSQYKDAEKIWYSALALYEKADYPKNIIPHSPYSLSRTLFQKLRDFSKSDSLLSMHHLESIGEIEYFDSATGPIAQRMNNWGLQLPAHIPTKERPLKSIAEFIMNNDNILLIHNTFVEDKDVDFANMNFKNTYYGLCPNANLFIENKLPPIDLLMDKKVNICLGTDSLASNHSLSIFEEMKTLDRYYEISLEELLLWATINGARALKMDSYLGSISLGKTPGLIGIKNISNTYFHTLQDAEFVVLK